MRIYHFKKATLRRFSAILLMVLMLLGVMFIPSAISSSHITSKNSSTTNVSTILAGEQLYWYNR